MEIECDAAIASSARGIAAASASALVVDAREHGVGVIEYFDGGESSQGCLECLIEQEDLAG